MIFFGHLGITLFVGALLFMPLFFVAIGVMLPDIVDKTFFILGFLPCGRSLAHNLFFGPIVAAATYAITRRKDLALAILFGSYMHLIEDSRGFVPWLYTVVGYEFECMPIALHIGIFEIVTESVGIVLLLAVIFYRNKIIYLRERLNYVLKSYGDRRTRAKVRGKKRRNKK